MPPHCTASRLHTDEPVPLSLPNQWLWDIIDEFIYQFQAFSQYRSKLLKKGEDEVGTLRANTKIWNVHSVLNVLYSLVEKSKINHQLERYNQGGDPDSVAGEFGIHPLYKMLGYFSLIDSCYTNSLYISDMYVVFQQSLYSRVPACQITTYYYVGFAYLMMKRYQFGISSVKKEAQVFRTNHTAKLSKTI
ncbi:hypothetical protein pdam_00012709 [Pocillopora damicornis]|uniref:Eukaryotic translation initiation factor 3 subunit L n=1 Tax=Pocillopora damicornis TaxID=46731 RepID=A0A3M6UMU9_POCDA|nr:hypothetical protein pdam_00012709 [Pocillopora damicornis]